MTTKKTIKPKTKNLPASEIDLQVLAHEGTKEAINKIEAYLKSEKDPEKKDYAEMALEECELFYYSPANEKEEEEFLLCYIIQEKEDYILELEMKIDRMSAGMDRFALEKKVHEKVLLKHKNKKEDWKYFCLDDYVSMDRQKLEELKESIAYEKAWIAEAKKIITTARYKPCIPKRHLEHFDFDFDEEMDDYDDDCCDCDDCCCDYDDGFEDEIKKSDVPF
ncbi:MAG: hypothetical protein US83_C0012G0003 [Candidatus Falkowbacteria bacterium GW2011_GWC2_38_22]|uniref:Uncharacterized protein n=1 Tax=Candidatus Falkowbacteria bacterium GW2011_GWE1_38_31 TaxID=1618638 RepID=A0A0G0JSU8_9BACT|nr:MAG: hypothetical protein US73_C0010G0003 [Candidatus Falkowbacteria bacterium GW2011_GWF2_38_1205]KKQ60764.1 MAG: hypothetical protein US83_C0012G0003 [Candidatus Falkowbacteria bacterium GW2011_GWC2_38_22]KKQ62931.1 MAG: hypothetical protein US84_C0010G0003 [Candidatus Falkowbacteria bacterium GW2011_GWF1_38_22]KKQ64943.1 MAG: hypothetical protein US87_C0010G0003 [Candidatus Falkowbacteria bacterium GW2011_GWE2_38_254]KKQ69707.1 MAG: hypothetical protein US91_C0010G0003 [Candidatus Falkowb